MIYENNLSVSYTFDLGDLAEEANYNPYYVFLFGNGDMVQITNDDGFLNYFGTFETLANHFGNVYLNQYYDSTNINTMLYGVFVADLDNSTYCVMNSASDFNLYQPLNNGSYKVNYGYCRPQDHLLDANSVEYCTSGPIYNTLNVTSNYLNVTNESVLAGTGGSHVVMDYENVVSVNGGTTHYEKYQVVYGNNSYVGFHTVNNYLSDFTSGGFKLSCGRYEIDNHGADEFNNGYGFGYNDGYQNGFNDGVSSVGSEAHTAFAYLSEAFGAVNTIMNLQVLPHITLGLCFSIPLTLVLIMTIFRLVKK